MAAMPAGMAAMLVAIFVLAVLYAMVHQRGSGVVAYFILYKRSA